MLRPLDLMQAEPVTRVGSLGGWQDPFRGLGGGEGGGWAQQLSLGVCLRKEWSVREGFYHCHCCYFRVWGGEKALGELRKGGRGLAVPERCPQALPAPPPACGDCQAQGPGTLQTEQRGRPRGRAPESSDWTL